VKSSRSRVKETFAKFPEHVDTLALHMLVWKNACRTTREDE
jgi:hypothetical protein